MIVSRRRSGRSSRICDGEIRAELRRARISDSELLAHVREKGGGSAGDVKHAFLERYGKITVLLRPRGERAPGGAGASRAE